MENPIEVFRIENPDTMHGMWYEKDGTFNPFINKLTEGISKDLPMDFDPAHKKGGLDWYSAGKSVENMNQWFSPLDALELHQNNYKLFKFEVKQYQMREMECLFTREGIIKQEQIPLDVIWDINLNKI